MTSRADPAVPPASMLFRLVHDRHGLRLAIVLGNQAPGGLCPYVRMQRCHHCDIGLGEGVRFDTPMNLRRIEWLKAYYTSILPKVHHLVIYNSGSTLNPVELSLKVCDAILDFARSLPSLKFVSMESREAFVHPGTVMRVASLLGLDRELRIILGIESANDRIRNGILEKNMARSEIESAVRAIAVVREKAESNVLTDLALPGLSINILIGGPGTTASTTVGDAVATAIYGVGLAEAYRLPLGLNLHPYYPSRRGLSRFPSHSRPSPKVICESISAIAEHVEGKTVIFVGWQDEEHDQEPARWAAELDMLTKSIDQFNKTGRTDCIHGAWR